MEFDTRLSEALAEGIRGLPSIVVRDLAGDVVDDMGLRDAVGGVRANPSRDGATIAEEVSIEGRKGTAGESEFGSTVMGEERIGVLEEGNQDKEMINPVETSRGKN